MIEYDDLGHYSPCPYADADDVPFGEVGCVCDPKEAAMLAGMTEDEFDPIPTDGTLNLLYMILRKAEIVIDRTGDAIEISFRVKDRRFSDHYLTDHHDWPMKIGNDLKALLKQVWEEVNK